CTPDLSETQCNDCVEYLSNMYAASYSGRIGGTAFLPMCRYSYDIQRFYNGSTLVSPPPSSPPPNPPVSLPPPPPQVLPLGSTFPAEADEHPWTIPAILAATGYYGTVIFIQDL
ncbi:putative receptor-like protein kinase, partial [Tanacetum coccineum]